MKIFEPKPCVVCETMFTPKSSIHKTCSKECTTKFKYAYAAAKRAEKRKAAGKAPPKLRTRSAKHILTCIICGEEFTAPRPNRKTCSPECSQAIPERQKQETWERMISSKPIPEWLASLQTPEAARLREIVQRSAML